MAQARFYRSPLRPGVRARNFKSMLKYPEDRKVLQTAHMPQFVERCLQHAVLEHAARQRFVAALVKAIPHTVISPR